MNQIVTVTCRVLEFIKERLHQSDFDTACYRDSFLKQHIGAAFRRSDTSSQEEYLARLKQDPEELTKLTKFISIKVSHQSQERVFSELTDSLNPYGMLILGHTEILSHNYRVNFKILNKKYHIYYKIGE